MRQGRLRVGQGLSQHGNKVRWEVRGMSKVTKERKRKGRLRLLPVISGYLPIPDPVTVAPLRETLGLVRKGRTKKGRRGKMVMGRGKMRGLGAGRPFSGARPKD